MNQPSFTIQGEAAPVPAGPFVLKQSTKVGLVVLLLGLLWLRLMLRRRSRDRICSHCGLRNPPHRSHCTKCSAPLFGA
ncbi:MAG: hypothetical protein HY823_06755 [Acidobacteria bacterium]|nr:hypothetical protein [Acidobacteriota bacterium]